MIDIGTSFESFLYGYLIFVFCFIAMLGMGANEYLTDSNLESLEVPTPLPPEATDNWLTGFLGTTGYFIANIVFFFTLMSIDTGVALLGTMVFSPAIIFLLYGILKLFRGGG